MFVEEKLMFRGSCDSSLTCDEFCGVDSTDETLSRGRFLYSFDRHIWRMWLVVDQNNVTVITSFTKIYCLLRKKLPILLSFSITESLNFCDFWMWYDAEAEKRLWTIHLQSWVKSTLALSLLRFMVKDQIRRNVINICVNYRNCSHIRRRFDGCDC